jgi:hypothetical protein
LTFIIGDDAFSTRQTKRSLSLSLSDQFAESRLFYANRLQMYSRIFNRILFVVLGRKAAQNTNKKMAEERQCNQFEMPKLTVQTRSMNLILNAKKKRNADPTMTRQKK